MSRFMRRWVQISDAAHTASHVRGLRGASRRQANQKRPGDCMGGEAPSPEQRRNRLLTVRRFAIAMHAEDSRHEAPAADALGRALFRRTQPYIYSAEEIERLMEAAASLGPRTLRPLTYVTLFGLLAATGMRISEALALRTRRRHRRRTDHQQDQVQEEQAYSAPSHDSRRHRSVSLGALAIIRRTRRSVRIQRWNSASL